MRMIDTINRQKEEIRSLKAHVAGLQQQIRTMHRSELAVEVLNKLIGKMPLSAVLEVVAEQSIPNTEPQS